MAAAKAMEIDTLHQIDTGLDPVTAEREQWDDGNNTLALAPRVAVAYERNDGTNDRLEEAGIEVVRIAGSELGSGRGGPRCMSCPVSREPLPRGLTPRSHRPGRRIPATEVDGTDLPLARHADRWRDKPTTGSGMAKGPGRCRRGRQQRPGGRNLPRRSSAHNRGVACPRVSGW